MSSNSSLQISGSPLSPLKRLRMSNNSVERQQENYVSLATLSPGVDATVKVMVCRRWDASNTTGKYLSTDFILSDSTGNAIHCVARSSIAHCFTSKLEVGGIYSIRRFTVLQNRDTYRVRRDDANLIQLEGYSIVRKLDCPPTGFERYPVSLLDIEYIILNGNHFLVDVVGCVVNMGKLKPTKNGSQLLDFELQNERGRTIKVSLWGGLCDDLLKRVRGAPDPYIILLPSLNVREYRGEVFVSSTSATCIYDTNDISAITRLRETIQDGGVPEPDYNGPLLQLLMQGRQLNGQNRAHSVTMHCTVTILRIDGRNSWHYFSCGAANCRKGLRRVENSFWCESCDRVCEFPVPRFRLELEVSDATTSLYVTVFDEIAEAMVKKTCSTLLQEHDDEDEDDIPHQLLQLINTTHVLELKTHTYYDHGEFESFTASRLIRTLDPGAGPSKKAPVNLKVIPTSPKEFKAAAQVSTEEATTEVGGNDAPQQVSTEDDTTEVQQPSLNKGKERIEDEDGNSCETSSPTTSD